jgi:hypothetical protein
MYTDTVCETGAEREAPRVKSLANNHFRLQIQFGSHRELDAFYLRQACNDAFLADAQRSVGKPFRCEKIERFGEGEENVIYFIELEL